MPDAASFRRVQFMGCSPPCPPWANCGAKEGDDNSQSLPFAATLAIAVSQYNDGNLLGLTLETVRGTMMRMGTNADGKKKEPYMDTVKKFFKDKMPDMTVHVGETTALKHGSIMRTSGTGVGSRFADNGAIGSPLPTDSGDRRACA